MSIRVKMANGSQGTITLCLLLVDFCYYQNMEQAKILSWNFKVCTFIGGKIGLAGPVQRDASVPLLRTESTFFFGGEDGFLGARNGLAPLLNVTRSEHFFSDLQYSKSQKEEKKKKKTIKKFRNGSDRCHGDLVCNSPNSRSQTFFPFFLRSEILIKFV